MNKLQKLILGGDRKVAFPLALYPGARLVGCAVSNIVTNAAAQFEAALALHKRYKTPIVITAMDLSVEAEAFGCATHFAEDEVPTISAPAIASEAEIDSLRIPEPGEKRTSIYLETTSLLKSIETNPNVFSVMIGPFSLAGRLIGMNEILCMTITNFAAAHKLIEKCSMFLLRYAESFKKRGADGLLIAEPAAGLLSPAAVEEFSSKYIKQIVDVLQDESFVIILHNCAARLQHLNAKIAAGTFGLHFGAPMDIVEAARRVTDKVVFGNLDPTSIFLKATPEQTYAKTKELLEKTSGFKNFVISSGCDIPAGTNIENIDAFYEACSNALRLCF
ncbi:MAG: uroporphyrinogen decarboxylase family protein [Verrucomicrobiia bacterium]